MSLMNCTFTVRWMTRKRNCIKKPTLPKMVLSELKMAVLEHGVRSVDIAVKINNKPVGGLKTGDKPSETEAE